MGSRTMNGKRAAVLVAAGAAIALGVGGEQAAVATNANAGDYGTTAAAAPAAGTMTTASRSTLISFTAKRETVHQVDVAPHGASIGDQNYVGGVIVKGTVRGYTSAQCVTVTTEDHTISQCEVDLLLTHGTIVTLGTATDASPVVHLAVVGGTGVYSTMSGSGALRPTPAGSVVSLQLD